MKGDTQYNRHKAGLCARCGKADPQTAEGRWLCASCAAEARAKANTPEAKEKRHLAWLERKARREAEGLCTHCGMPTTPPYKTCKICRAKNYATEKYRAHKESKP